MDTPDTTLSSKTVCAIGRFAAMSQKEFRRSAAELGCRTVLVPNTETDLVIVGDEGCSDSSKALVKAWELRKSGARLEFLSESDFYRLAGQVPGDARIVRRLTITDLAKSLNVPAAKLRQWMRWGLLKPVEVIHRLELFNFAAVSAAKKLRQLAASDIAVRQIRRELDRLRDRLSDERITQDDLIEQNGRLLVRHRGQLLDGGGQCYFDFSRGNESVPTLEIPAPPEDIAQIFEAALLAESTGRLDQAIKLYQKTLLLEANNPVLFFNLGNTFYARGRYEEACESFQRALRLDDRYAEAWNNLGSTYLEQEKWPEAINAFVQALKLVGSYQDARRNLDLALSLLAEKRRTRIYPNERSGGESF